MSGWWMKWRYPVWFAALALTAAACVLCSYHDYMPGVIMWLAASTGSLSYAVLGAVLYRRGSGRR